MASGYDPRVARIIEQVARQRGLDPEAMLAVAGGEGGVRYGAVGDSGTSFGPFQLHEGGALPKKYWGDSAAAAAFANSPAGIEYVARKMVEAGAAGLTGEAAVNTIIRKFERPADPDTSVRNAIGRLGESPQTGGTPAPMTTPAGGTSLGNPLGIGLQGGAAPNFKQLMTNFLMESSTQAAEGKVPSSSSLLQLASMRKALGAAESAFGPMPTATPQAGTGPLAPPTSGGANAMLAAIDQAKKMGLSVGGNPYVTGRPETSGHTENSHHYETFAGSNIGRAIDVSGSPEKLAAYFEWAEQNLLGNGLNDMFYDPKGYSYDKGKRWDATIGGHNHVHLSV